MASHPGIHVVKNTALVFFLSLLLVIQLACGGGNSSNGIVPNPPSTPAFSSTPVTIASEGSAYSYLLAASDPAGGSVSFTLTAGPDGATLSGNTVSWTPTPAQSRVPNSFTVTAKTNSGGSATQSWTVTPTGTVRITWVNYLWNQSGSTQVPFDWSQVRFPISALVPQPDGSFQAITGSVVNGVFAIPDVPGGYYWLELSPGEAYWTSSSNFDLGWDYPATASGALPFPRSATLMFNVTGLDPIPANGWMQVVQPYGPFFHFDGPTVPGSTTWTGGASLSSNADLSVIKSAFISQYEPAVLGPLNGFVLGPEVSLTNLSLTNGAVNTINAALNSPKTASMSLAINASAWGSLFDRVAPAAPIANGGTFGASVQPDATSHVLTAERNINLIWLAAPGYPGPSVLPGSCSNSASWAGTPTPTLPPALVTDFDAGTISYSDPFPNTWLRMFSVVQCAAVQITLPSTNSAQIFLLSNVQTTALPNSPVDPLISPVQNPKINGDDLFTPNTVGNKGVAITWAPPAVGTATGYEVQIYAPTDLNSGSPVYMALVTLGTKQTSITIPPTLLAPNKTYLFMITAFVDGLRDMETIPHRSALPVASANVISAPITIN